jgi:hypothetical protein
VLILKVDKVVCFDAVLQVLILKEIEAGLGRRGSWLVAEAPPHTPGISYEYKSKGLAKWAIRN